MAASDHQDPIGQVQEGFLQIAGVLCNSIGCSLQSNDPGSVDTESFISQLSEISLRIDANLSIIQQTYSEFALPQAAGELERLRLQEKELNSLLVERVASFSDWLREQRALFRERLLF